MKSQVPEGKGSGVGRVWSPLELAEVKTPRRIGSIWRAKGATSRRRITFDDRASCYHLMSRTVNGEFLFGATEKEAFRRMMWRVSSFLGVEVLTYVVMDNHFHILVKVPERAKWLARFEGEEGERSLLKHLATLYSKKFIAQLERELREFRGQGNERAAGELIERFMKRFCDVSVFMKELKERFSRWFNKQNGRRGPLWMDRFKSVLVDGEDALATMAAYIDLNPVRAGIVADPLDYEWSGYGEACAGSRRAKRGISKALSHPQDLWEKRTLPRYRIFLFDEGVEVEDERTSKKAKRRGGVSKGARLKVQAEGGVLSGRVVLRKRISSFTNGVVYGRRKFVREVAERYREMMGQEKVRKSKKLGEGRGRFVVQE
jgi:putative transposase